VRNDLAGASAYLAAGNSIVRSSNREAVTEWKSTVHGSDVRSASAMLAQGTVDGQRFGRWPSRNGVGGCWFRRSSRCRCLGIDESKI